MAFTIPRFGEGFLRLECIESTLIHLGRFHNASVMFMVPAIIMGDSTTGGGKVIEGSPNSTIMGKPIARMGDKATCPINGHGGVVTILEGDATNTIDGKPTAFHMATLSCGCKVIGSQSIYMVEKASGGSSSAKSSATEAKPASPPTKEALAAEFNDFFVMRDATGKPVPNAHYAVEFPDGSFEYGVTDDKGHTDLHVTGEEAQQLTLYLQAV